MGAIGEELGAELQLRAGVLTGEAAVTLGATNQGMVAGDLVNTASRLQSVAPPGTVLVGEATLPGRQPTRSPSSRPASSCSRARPRRCRRSARCASSPSAAASGRSEQLEAPFVGRAPELRLLKDFHVATGAERRPRLVSIIGQGGIGKSRLVWEFQKYIDGVTEVVYWHQGRSPAYGEGISFWALAEMVRGRADDHARPTTRRRRAPSWRHALDEWVTDEAERRWIEPRAASAPGPRGSEMPMSDRTASRSSPPGASSSSASPSTAW